MRSKIKKSGTNTDTIQDNKNKPQLPICHQRKEFIYLVILFYTKHKDAMKQKKERAPGTSRTLLKQKK